MVWRCFTIRPQKRVAGVFLTQVLPFADGPATQIYGDFEKAVYGSAGRSVISGCAFWAVVGRIPFDYLERSSWLTASKAGDPVEVKFTCRTPATSAGRNSRPKRLIEGKTTPVQLFGR